MRMGYNEHMFGTGKAMEFIKKNMTTVVAVSVLTVAAFLYAGLRLTVHGQAAVIVFVEGREYGTYPLDENRELWIETEQGHNLLVIEDGQAYVRESDCKNRVCVKSRPVTEAGGQIVCLPHKVLIQLKATEESEIDAGTN